MKTIKIILSLLVLMATASTVAQQDPNYIFYRYSMNLVNPAYAGASESSELGLNIRNQWVGVEGAPETQSLFFGTHIGKNIGLGISVINDKTFIERQTSIMIDVSYRINLSRFTTLFFGIKAGASSYNVNTAGLTSFGIGSDPSLTGLDGTFSPNVGAGAYLKGQSYFVSLSVPKVLSPDRIEQGNGLAKLGSDKVHMYLSAGHDFDLGKSVIFKPSFMVRYVDSAPVSMDLTAAFLLKERIELGLAYRLNEGIAGMLIFNASDRFAVGYAYEAAFESPVSDGSLGTHEIILNIKF